MLQRLAESLLHLLEKRTCLKYGVHEDKGGPSPNEPVEDPSALGTKGRILRVDSADGTSGDAESSATRRDDSAAGREAIPPALPLAVEERFDGRWGQGRRRHSSTGKQSLSPPPRAAAPREAEIAQREQGRQAPRLMPKDSRRKHSTITTNHLGLPWIPTTAEMRADPTNRPGSAERSKKRSGRPAAVAVGKFSEDGASVMSAASPIFGELGGGSGGFRQQGATAGRGGATHRSDDSFAARASEWVLWAQQYAAAAGPSSDPHRSGVGGSHRQSPGGAAAVPRQPGRLPAGWVSATQVGGPW